MRSYIIMVVCLSMLAGAVAAAEKVKAVLPHFISAEQLEVHGEFHGDEFWLRLKPAQAQFNGRRVVELLYTPRSEEEAGGTHLVDHPFLLVDNAGRIIAWNERQNGLSSVVWNSKPAGYSVVRERSQLLVDGSKAPMESPYKLGLGSPVWDARLAHLMLALTWKKDDEKTRGVHTLDFFAAEVPKSAVTAFWQGDTFRLGQFVGTVTADEQGRLKTLNDADGKNIVTIHSWITAAETVAK